jgi:hypothetical protein
VIGGVKAEVPTQALFGLVTLHFGFDSPESRSSGGGILYHNNWVITARHLDNGADVQVLFAENIADQHIIKNNPANIRHLGDSAREGIAMVRLPRPFIRRGDPVMSRAVLNRDPAAPYQGQSLKGFGRGHSKFDPSGEPEAVTGPKVWKTENFTVTRTDPPAKTFEVNHGEFGALLVSGDSGGPFFSDDDAFVYYGCHQWSEWTPTIPSKPILATQNLIAPYANDIDGIANSVMHAATLTPRPRWLSY